MISFCQFGAGRIGAIHAENIARHPGARLHAVVDVDRAAAERLGSRHGSEVATQASVLVDRSIQAVVIASSTNTHADLVEAAARAGKAVFCEKPLDLDRRRAEACLAVVAECGVPLMVGFNRRFDPHFARLERQLRDGRAGRVELLSITSRDPSPPPLAYVRFSGGLFRDMMIHDFDMARWLLGEEPVEVFAAASVLVDPAIGDAGDVDTAVVTLRTGSGALCQISNSRRAVYGYDQRIEVLGSKGALRADNVALSTVRLCRRRRHRHRQAAALLSRTLCRGIPAGARPFRRRADPRHAAAARRQRRGQGVGVGGCRVAVAADPSRHPVVTATPVKAGKQGEFSIPFKNLPGLSSIKPSGSDT
jgi:myo-inositol 2-dehydrogenase/D-chiro-inositol 1-dehydrogenase